MIRLPVPPSANNLFANRKGGGGRFKTAEYQAWLTEAGWKLKAQRPARVDGPFVIEMKLPRNCRGDIDNRNKGVLDLLVKHGVVRDDSLAQRLVIERADVNEMIIEVRAA